MNDTLFSLGDNAIITISSDMSCTDGKVTFFPTTMYAVMDNRAIEKESRWFDYLAGDWRGAMCNTTLTPNLRLARLVAKQEKARVVPYLIVACKHGTEDYSDT